MTIVVHRIQKIVRDVKPSLVTEEIFPSANWIWDPSITAEAQVANTKYWIITGDSISLMDSAQRAIVDADELIIIRDDLANNIEKPETYERAFALLILDEINNLRAEHSLLLRTVQQLKNALRNKMDI